MPGYSRTSPNSASRFLNEPLVDVMKMSGLNTDFAAIVSCVKYERVQMLSSARICSTDGGCADAAAAAQQHKRRPFEMIRIAVAGK